MSPHFSRYTAAPDYDKRKPKQVPRTPLVHESKGFTLLQHAGFAFAACIAILVVTYAVLEIYSHAK